MNRRGLVFSGGVEKSIKLMIIFALLALAGCGGAAGDYDPELAVENSAPSANGGSDQNVVTGSLVTLDGSGSVDADGDLLEYRWAFISSPAESTATLADPTAVRTTFTADLDGTYLLRLIVNDGFLESQADMVTITAATLNSAPVAKAGADQNVATGSLVTLDGSGSSDADGDLLAYNWKFISRPAGSSAALTAPTAAMPAFTADLDGTYILELIVNDGFLESQADRLTITAATWNSAPVANAGPDQHVATGSLVTLDGSGSVDADGDPLAYNWTFTAKPAGSSAALSNRTAANPTFIADLGGDYVLKLIVNDGQLESQADSVIVFGYSVDNEREDIIVDNGSAGTTANGTWVSSREPDPYGAGSLYSTEMGASYTFQAPVSGIHDLYLWWTQNPDRGNSVPVEIHDAEILIDRVFVDQRLNGGRWNWLGSYLFSGAARIGIISSSQHGTTCADAVRLVPIADTGPNLTLTSPARYHLQTSPDLITRAEARYLENGWGVRFLLDAGAQIIDSYSPPYEGVFHGIPPGEHIVEALVIDELGLEVSGPDARDQLGRLGIGAYYVAMGDSITWGVGDDLSFDNISLDGRNNSSGYLPILNDLLTGAEMFPHYLANEGIGGTRSGGGKEDGRAIVGALLNKHYDARIFLVQYGTNDSYTSWNPVPSGLGLWPGDYGYSGSYKDNMQQIIDAVHRAGREVYLAKVPIVLGETSRGIPFDDPESASRNQLIREYNKVVEELVVANRIPVPPPDFYGYFTEINPGTGRYRYQEEFSDNLHPNGLGYRSMARLWAEAITDASADY